MEQILTRQRIVSAAGKLFYGQGIGRSSMEDIAEAAGLTKRALYYHFRSKDDLVEAWLQDLDRVVLESYRTWLHAVPGSVEDRVRGMFSALAVQASNPRWKGCGFARAANELAGMPGHPGIRAAQSHRKRFRDWLAEELEADGVSAPDRTALRIILLLDGAIVQALIHHDPAYIEEAGNAAADVIAEARRAIGCALAISGRPGAAVSGGSGAARRVGCG